MASSITPERFAQGMTFDQYIAYLGSPENLAREPHVGTRADLSAALQAAFEKRRPSANQLEAFQWLVAQPNGPPRCWQSLRNGPRTAAAICQLLPHRRRDRHGTANFHA